MRMWVYNPHSGGKKAPPAVQERIRRRILKHAAKHYAGKYDRIDVRFRGALCYVDAYVESSPYPLHLVRLRYNGNEDSMSVAFYTYSHEKYEPTFFLHGDHGTPEEAFDIGAVYLQ
ncbi:MAG: hypothetical protein HY238_15895 [Acidobacteria bacterium]|nr:hypothetical protein [Acidobacteriota bacterium]